MTTRTPSESCLGAKNAMIVGTSPTTTDAANRFGRGGVCARRVYSGRCKKDSNQAQSHRGTAFMQGGDNFLSVSSVSNSACGVHVVRVSNCFARDAARSAHMGVEGGGSRRGVKMGGGGEEEGEGVLY